MINSHIVIYTYSHCNIYTLIVNKNLVLICNNNMNSLYMENHTSTLQENHTSTLYTHLDKLKQVNLSIYAQLKVPHTFEFKWYKNEETFTIKPPISLFLNNKN